jgi:hypothetical protein
MGFSPQNDHSGTVSLSNCQDSEGIKPLIELLQ